MDEAFCGRPGEKRSSTCSATSPSSRGDPLAEAESWWTLLVPPAAAKGDALPTIALFYPDPQTDSARHLAAKLLLARLFRGAYGWADDFAGVSQNLRHGRGLRWPARRAGTPTSFSKSPTSRDADPSASHAPIGRPSAAMFLAARTAVAAALLERLGALCRSSNEHQYSLKDRQEVGRGADARQGGRSYPAQPLDGF